MKYNIYEEDFKKMDLIFFNEWNEAYIRVDFIAPLLKLLGYEKNIGNSMLEKKFIIRAFISSGWQR